eukprot:274407_1
MNLDCIQQDTTRDTHCGKYFEKRKGGLVVVLHFCLPSSCTFVCHPLLFAIHFCLEFHSLYSEYDFIRHCENVPLIRLATKTGTEFNNRIIDDLYTKYITAVLTKGCWSITRNKQYTKASVSLRTKLKNEQTIKSANKGLNPSMYCEQWLLT